MSNKLFDSVNSLITSKIRAEPLNEIHLPSMALGFLIPLFFALIKPVLSSVLVSLLTFLKYVIIVGGILLCGVYLINKTTTTTTTTCNSGSSSSTMTRPIRHFKQDGYYTETVTKNALPRKEAFDAIKYQQIPIEHSQHGRPKEVDVENPYENFVNMASKK